MEMQTRYRLEAALQVHRADDKCCLNERHCDQHQTWHRGAGKSAWGIELSKAVLEQECPDLRPDSAKPERKTLGLQPAAVWEIDPPDF
jgi:hypothetical protein